MKTTRKFMAIVMVFAMILSMGVLSAFAATVDNQTKHTYDAYQIFSGTQADGKAALGEVKWGTNISTEDPDGDGEKISNAAKLLDALKADSRFEVKKLVDGEEVSVNIFAAAQSAADVAEALSANATDTIAKAFANVVENYVSGTPVAIIAADAKNVSLPAGYYVLIDTTIDLDADDDGVNEDVLNSALLQVTNKGAITIEKKYSVPEEGKKIVEGANKVDSTTKSIGDTVKFELKGTLPSNYADYETYKFVFHDDMTDGLTFDGVNTVEVFLGDANGYTASGKITGGFATSTNTTDYCDLEVSFENLKSNTAITKDTVIYVTYTATLNEDAAINDANSNTVTLEYSNDPNFDGDGDNDGEPDDDVTPPTGKTPGKTVNVYTTKVTILKKDGTSHEILPGAAFKITGDSANIVVTSGKIFVAYAADEVQVAGNKYWELTDGNFTETDPTSTPADGSTLDTSKYVDTNVVYKMVDNASLDTNAATPVDAEGFVNDTTGKLTFSGLGVGTYTITETVVPAGYNKVADITLVIGYEDDEFTYTWSGGATGDSDEVTVDNFAGSTLPETGAMGTVIFIAVGSLIAVAAVCFLVTKKRMQNRGMN